MAPSGQVDHCKYQKPIQEAETTPSNIDLSCPYLAATCLLQELNTYPRTRRVLQLSPFGYSLRDRF
jgi:hypothetical protein